MAECIRGDWLIGPLERPQVGAQAMVQRVVPGRSSAGRHGIGLKLFGYAGAWDAGAFRKLPQAWTQREDQVERSASIAPARSAVTSAN